MEILENNPDYWMVSYELWRNVTSGEKNPFPFRIPKPVFSEYPFRRFTKAQVWIDV